MQHHSTRRNILRAPNVRPRTALWIGYQMRVKGISQRTIASRAGVGQPLVARTLAGTRNSARVQAAIAEALGYQTWGALLAHARRAA